MTWDTGYSSGEIRAVRLDGVAWQQLPPAESVDAIPGISVEPSVAVDSFGNPVVAWQDNASGQSQIYVKRLTGAIWQELPPNDALRGGVSDTDTRSIQPTLALDDVGDATVAWLDGGSLYVKHFNGSQWQEVGVGSATGVGLLNDASQITYNPRIGLGVDGPVVVWLERYAEQVKAGIFSQTAWQVDTNLAWDPATVGGTSFLTPDIAIDSDGYPVIAVPTWASTSPAEIFVRRFDGTSWSDIGTDLGTGTGVGAGGVVTHVHIALDSSDNPIVAWQDGAYTSPDVRVKRFDGTSWQEVGADVLLAGGVLPEDGLINIKERGNGLDLVVDASDNPILVWEWMLRPGSGGVGPSEIYAAAFDGTDWVERGTGSASGGGISNNDGWSTEPSIVVDAEGNPIVAWTDDTSGNREIYARRLVGTEWQEIGVGSASLGGVSNSANDSDQVTIAVAGSRLCLAWSELGSIATEIVMRCRGLQ